MADEVLCIAVIAAGCSYRFGGIKQVAPLNGEPMAWYACKAAKGARRLIGDQGHGPAVRLALVLGAHGDVVGRTLGRSGILGGFDIVFNKGWSEGQASSVREAVAYARTQRATWLMVVAADMPFVDGAHLATLFTVSRGMRAGASAYTDHVGVPAVFSRNSFGLLEGLRGDQGACRMLNRQSYADGAVVCVRFATPEMAFDVDTPEQLRAAQRMVGTAAALRA